MPSLPIVEHLNVFCDLLNRFSPGKTVAMVGQFLLEDSQKLSNGALSKQFLLPLIDTSGPNCLNRSGQVYRQGRDKFVPLPVLLHINLFCYFKHAY
jgi:hypothetical protein